MPYASDLHHDLEGQGHIYYYWYIHRFAKFMENIYIIQTDLEKGSDHETDD